MKINRLDLVEYDAGSGAMFGKTYLTIFSPRMQSYTIGLEPSSPRMDLRRTRRGATRFGDGLAGQDQGRAPDGH